MEEKSISNFDFLLLKISALPQMQSILLNIIFRHVSLSQKGNFIACSTTEKVKEAQRCGLAVVINYKSGSWKGG